MCFWNGEKGSFGWLDILDLDDVRVSGRGEGEWGCRVVCNRGDGGCGGKCKGN